MTRRKHSNMIENQLYLLADVGLVPTSASNQIVSNIGIYLPEIQWKMCLFHRESSKKGIYLHKMIKIDKS